MTNWDGKEGRCDMYCKGLSDSDWWDICDCWEVQRVLKEEPPYEEKSTNVDAGRPPLTDSREGP